MKRSSRNLHPAKSPTPNPQPTTHDPRSPELPAYGENPHGTAHGAPGVPAKWTHADKSGVGCALSPASNVWFSLSHGIVTEIYHPDPSQAAVRDIGLIITNGKDFFSEEKSDTTQKIEQPHPGIPIYRLTNTHKSNRYRIEKEILVDPGRDVLLQRVRFLPLQGTLHDFQLYAILSPRLGDRGAGNTAWAARYKGIPLLFAQRGSHALAFASSAGWLRRSVGFVGASDAWQDLHQNKRLTEQHQRADDGHVAIAGEIDLASCNGQFLLATAIDFDPNAAALTAILALQDDFDTVRSTYIDHWQTWQKNLLHLDQSKPDQSKLATRYRSSTMVLRVHRAPRFGSAVASLAIPWGESRGDDETGGYHLVWTRDMAESASGLLAAGAHDEITHTLQNLRAIQEPDGHWPQDMWVNGCPHAKGIQLDEVALPILLLDLAHRNRVLSDADLASYWPMVRRAASYLSHHGPVTEEDRWENTPGYSPFTLAVEIPALLIASQLAETFEKPCAAFLRDLADEWNSQIESWTYATNTDLSRRLKIDGYYVRIASPDKPINQDPDAAKVVSPDALALVRYGLRAANDPRILNTIRAIDELTRVETPSGPSWHRYNGDHYGEHDDGTPPVHGRTEGRGRAWPLLTGERGHYELAAGNLDAAQKSLAAMNGFASDTGLISEQIWDTIDSPQHYLFRGRPTGSAMPLAWAHAEYIRLLRSLKDKKIFDLPPQVHQRYVRQRVTSNLRSWRFDRKIQSIPAKKLLRISVLAPAIIRFSTDHWRTFHELPTQNSQIGIHFADLPISKRNSGDGVIFTFRWLPQERWEGKDFAVAISDAGV